MLQIESNTQKELYIIRPREIYPKNESSTFKKQQI